MNSRKKTVIVTGATGWTGFAIGSILPVDAGMPEVVERALG